jgi:HEAT repeat protein
MPHTQQTILPILSRLLGDSKAEVRATAGQALKGVASLMKPSDLGQYVLTIVLQLAHDDANEELVSAICIMYLSILYLIGLCDIV